jgi:predicted aminopeptidase
MKWVIAAAGLAISAAVLSSCSLPFYWQAANGQLQLLRAREPIESVLADPDTAPEVRGALEDVERIRAFATSQLMLPDNGSYESYADLGRDYVVWNVVAAEEFSTVPERWCFPFAGCVAYRGFFDRENAEAFEARMQKRGLDTYSGGSDAYSTLGYFADPVLNTMLDSSIEEIAAILIHELAHQRIYIKGDSELSEAFASTVEEHGTRLWLQDTEATAALERYEARLRARAVFAELIASQQRRLADIYARPVTESEKRAAKAQAFSQLREEYSAARNAGDLPSGYDGWFAQDLNNASLAAVATYRRWVPALRARLQLRGLEAFYDDVEALAALDPVQRDQTLQFWDGAADASTSAMPDLRVAAQYRASGQ